MLKMTVHSTSAEETFHLGQLIAAAAGPGWIFALDGDLGTGKTVFAQGFASALGVTEYVSSPTFTILQVYEDGRLPLYHFDVYRIEEPEELEEIGYEEYFFSDGVCLVEWAELVKELLPPETVFVRMEKDVNRGFDYRNITISVSDPEKISLLKAKLAAYVKNENTID